MPDENTIYYVFSTIAQTLAGIVGILAAFAVMRLSDLSARLREELPCLAECCEYPQVFYEHLADGDFAGAISLVRQDYYRNSRDDLVLDACRRMEDERKYLVAALRCNLLLAGVVISFSVASLILARWLASDARFAWAAVITGLIGLMSCLVIVGVLVTRLGPVKLLRKRKKHVKVRRNSA